MIRITQLKLPVSHSQEELRKKIARSLRCSPDDLSYEIIRQSLDARHKDDKKFVYTVDVTVSGEKKILKKVHNNNIMYTRKQEYHFPESRKERSCPSPVIAGSGPAGLFCAWYLAYAGYRPLILERGEEAAKRQKTVEHFWKNGVLDPDSNVQFGEGGAGTFSDGKLNTLVKDSFGRNREVLRRFVKAGAPREILYQQKPHLGTDVLIHIVQTLRRQIEEMGGRFRFRSKLTDLFIKDGRLNAVEINGSEKLPAEICVLAPGHSARDTFQMLKNRGIHMEPKSFAVGLRIEHPQEMINQALYGETENTYLGPASYKLTHSCQNGRGVYSFCMCPGGYVVNASSEEGRVAVNGMSYHDRAGRNANSAVIVTVTPEDFGGEDPLAGVEFQRQWERAAFRLAGGDYSAPAQRVADLLAGVPSKGFGGVLPTYEPGVVPGDISQCLPSFVVDSMKAALPILGRRLQGFDSGDALLTAPETRSSSPVRILRDETCQSPLAQGLYPCGEGAGYAGGIVSAAVDGLRCAEAVLQGN